MIATLRPPTETTTDLPALIRQHQRNLWRYARVLGCSAAETDELIQDAFVVLWRKNAASGVASRDAAYLRKLVRDGFVDRVRARDREARAHANAVERVWEQEPEGDRVLEALVACRDELGGRSAAVVAAFYERRLGRDAVAEELGMTENGVKTLLQRTRAALRACVQRRLSTEEEG